MRRSNVGNVALASGAISFLFVVIAFIVGAFLLGPYCLAYDLNHLVPLVTNKPLGVSMWNPAVLVGGFFLSETAIPVAIVVWILVTVGVLV